MHPAIWRAMGDGLVALAQDSGAAQLVPDLATAVPVPTDGGRTYVFRLRPGIRYSTGVPVRASDLRRELERLYSHQQPGRPSTTRLCRERRHARSGPLPATCRTESSPTTGPAPSSSA